MLVREEQEIVMIDSPKAAEYKTNIKGWVSRLGYFFGDDPDAELKARFSGCNHVRCTQCGAPTPKRYIKCDTCRVSSEIERYNAKPKCKWDGESPIYSERLDLFFDSLDDAYDFEHDHVDLNLSDLRLVICEPVYCPSLRPDLFEDELPDDEPLPDAVHDAIDAFNKATKKIRLSWSPGRYALDLAALDE